MKPKMGIVNLSGYNNKLLVGHDGRQVYLEPGETMEFDERKLRTLYMHFVQPDGEPVADVRGAPVMAVNWAEVQQEEPEEPEEPVEDEEQDEPIEMGNDA